MQAAESVAVAVQPRASLVTRMAQRYGVEPNKMLTTLKATAFHTVKEITNEQMMALLVVADQYGLNPWTKEIYAFPDSNRGIVPVVGLDGWARIINESPHFDGMTFAYGPSGEKFKGAPLWIECTMYRKDRPEHPCTVREHMVECFRETGPWQSHPARMLRHKTMIQCARLAFGFVGVFDPDEAERIIEGAVTLSTPAAVDDLNAEITGKQPEQSSPATVDESAQVFTYAQVAKAINAAGDGDAFNLAVDMVRNIVDPAQREELTALAKKRREGIEAQARG